ARVRVAAREGLERHHRMPARCGHCSTRASDQMLRRIVPTAERTVSPGQRPKAIDKGAAIRERPLMASTIWCLPSEAVKQFIRIGVDLAKYYFQIHALSSAGAPAIKRKVMRRKMREFFSQT